MCEWALLCARIALLLAWSGDDQAGTQPAPAGGRLRYSLSLTDEASVAAGFRGAGPDRGNLVLLQPSITYRQEHWIFSSSVAAEMECQNGAHERIGVRETYVGVSLGNLDFTVGKRLLRWGTGYVFTATGVLDPPRVVTDPSDRLSLYQGRELAKADWTGGSQSLSVVWASAGLVGARRTGFYDTTAVRYNFLAGGFDTSVVVSHDGGGTNLAGANFTRVFGRAFEMHGEFAWREEVAILLGGKYTTGSGVTVVAELYSPPHTAYYRPADLPATAGRQRYGFLSIGKSRLRELPGWKEWDLTASLVANLNDASRTAVFDVKRRIGNHFAAYVHAEAPGGRKLSSEYGQLPYSSLVSVGLRLQW